MKTIERILSGSDFERLNNMMRGNGISKIKSESVSQHSFVVTFLSRILAEEIFEDVEIKLDIATYAMFHDFDEIFSGDILNPLKYNDFNGDDLRISLDDFITHEVESTFIEDTKTDNLIKCNLLKRNHSFIFKLVKICDWIAMSLYLQNEVKLGNNNVYSQLEFCDKSALKAIEEFKESLKPFYTVFAYDFKILDEI